jgi:manganese oxidase
MALRWARPAAVAFSIVSLAAVFGACGSTTGGGGAQPSSSSMSSMDMPMDTSAPTLSADEMDAKMALRTKAFPQKTSGLGAQPMQPKVLADGTREFDMVSAITPWEVEAGKVVQAWTYNGVVPGPTIHVNVGDRVRVVLMNHLPESTSIHFHGIKVPNAQDGVPDITQAPIKPGQTYVYDFTATEAAVGMYHSHQDAVKQVPNALVGAFIVGEMPVPAGVTVAQELPMVLDDSGPVGLSINGKSFPATAPVVAKLGDYVMVHYYNAGQMAHPMHLHGPYQLVVAKDGYPLPQPYRADTVMIGPGERYTVLVHADQLGVWAWHCHILSHAEGANGMFGMVTALVVTG